MESGSPLVEKLFDIDMFLCHCFFRGRFDQKRRKKRKEFLGRVGLGKKVISKGKEMMSIEKENEVRKKEISLKRKKKGFFLITVYSKRYGNPR